MNARPLVVYSVAALISVGLARCATKPHGAAHTSHGVHWSYSGDTGPSFWGRLAPEYALCATGLRQSPIDITSTTPRDLSNIVFSYRASALEIVNNGHTVQVNAAPGSHIEIDGERFELAQFHFHAPSEHLVNGKHADAEMHLVHKAADGRLAVVGVMLREGPHNAAFDPVWNSIPARGKQAKLPSVMVNAASLLPSDQRTYRYDGSLTTPPGTEGVKWNLMVEPVTMSRSQLSAFRRHYSGNNRPVQPLNGREVWVDTTP